MEMKALISTINHSLAIELPEKLTESELRSHLNEYINTLIRDDFERLVALLYRIDVSETKLKYLLLENPHQDAAKIIAALIIERQKQKIRLRKRNKPDTDIPEIEKW